MVPSGAGAAAPRQVLAHPLAGPRWPPPTWVLALATLAVFLAAGALATLAWPTGSGGIASSVRPVEDSAAPPELPAPITSTEGPAVEVVPATAEPDTGAPPASAAAPAAEAPVATPALPAVLYVTNTEGLGVYLRSQPRDGTDTRTVAWIEGTAMVPLETTTVTDAAGAAVWVRVRDPQGRSGWVRQAYLAAARS
jgi:hypothetical protein